MPPEDKGRPGQGAPESAAGERQDSGTLAREPLALDDVAAANLLGIGRSTWWRLIASGRAPRGIQLGRCRRWPRAELEAWLAAGAPSRERWDWMRGGRP